MEKSFECVINGILEEIARKYIVVKREWQEDRHNLFKDGRFLAYYEIKEAVLKRLEDESLLELFDEISERFNAAKEDWKRDRTNLFKDGRLLAYFEVLRMFPCPA